MRGLGLALLTALGVLIPRAFPQDEKPAGHAEDCPKGCAPCSEALKKGLGYLAARHSKQKKGESFPSVMNDHKGIVGTSMVGLAFLAAGNTDSDGPYKANLVRCRDHIAAWAGKKAEFTWELAFAGLFLAELQAASPSDPVKEALQRIVQGLEKAQLKSGGWGHTEKGGSATGQKKPGGFAYAECLTVTTLLCLGALAEARQCGAKVGDQTLENGIKYVERASPKEIPGYSEEYPYATEAQAATRAAAALSFWARLRGKQDKAVATLAACARKHFPSVSPTIQDKHPYAIFFLAAAGMYLQGKEAWSRTQPFRDAMLKLQRDDGGWDETAAEEKVEGKSYSLFGDHRVYLSASYCIILSLPLERLPIVRPAR
ncbi:MAG TPA: DUF6288 domain-containing protein [Planctomycetota bacterium]|nr:DUF6288 domain-containing protein [Planctomycetota bacterium]